MLKTLKDLAIALINATLILIALCLFLAWKVTDKADQISSNFAKSLVTVQPLRDDIQGATGELAALRADLSQISEQSGALRSASLQRLQTQVEQMQARMDKALGSINDLSQAPTKLIDHAIYTGVDSLTQGIADIRGCVPPNS
jgi:uncharacterized phage infection (PIP) family protein YhgE